jgi:glycosyltransferase involved in cell wall biosynthesis
MLPARTKQPTPASRAAILYICYLGIAEPLVQTQVVPYLAGLSFAGYGVVLLTFEPARLAAADRRTFGSALKNKNIEWHTLRYHKRPALPATLADVVAGILYGAYLVRRKRIDVVHARSYVAAAMAVGLKWLLGRRVVFDMRGLMAEEYVDAGLWREGGFLYRLTKAMERVFLANADGMVLLTQRVGHWLLSEGILPDRQRPLAVIPCCVDPRRFEVDPLRVQRLRQTLGLDGHPIMVYAGKLGGWYMAREMVDFFCVARRHLPGLRFLVLTQSALTTIRGEFARKSLDPGVYRCLRVAPDDLPAYLRMADFAISFITPSFSKIASSPTKMAEYLAAGLPVVYNAGIGDLDGLQPERVGVLVTAFDERDYHRVIREMQVLLRDRQATALRCHWVAERYFGLATIGIPQYLKLYAALEGARVREVCGPAVHIDANKRMS